MIYLRCLFYLLALMLNSAELAAESSVKLYQSFVKANGSKAVEFDEFEKLLVIYQKDIDNNDDGIRDVGSSKKWADFKIDSEIKIIVADWEGEQMKMLRKQLEPRSVNKWSSDQEFDNLASTASTRYVELVEKLKSMFPGFKVGLYDVPPFNSDSLIKNPLIGDAIKVIVDVSDALFPSLYLRRMKPANRPNFAEIETKIQYALSLGCQQNRKVYAFINHRWHPASILGARELVSVKDFRELLAIVLGAHVDQCRVAGLVWWASDLYRYQQEMQPYLKDINEYHSYKAYSNSVLKRYAEELRLAIETKQ